MKTYEDYIQALEQLLEEAVHLPLGGWPDLPRPKLSNDAPHVLIFSPHPDDDGLEAINEHTWDNDPQYWSQCVSHIASILDKNRPDIIFYPHKDDWNTTHIGTHLLVVDGLKQMDPEFSCYCVETETWGLMKNPNLLIECHKKDVGDLINALSFHQGEIERNPYHLRLAARLIDNVMRGTELVGGQGVQSPDISFAALYRVNYWKENNFKQCREEGLFLLFEDDPVDLFKKN